jgi:hypothetical protein
MKRFHVHVHVADLESSIRASISQLPRAPRNPRSIISDSRSSQMTIFRRSQNV